MANAGDLFAAAAALLRSPKVADDFWKQPDQGAHLIWSQALELFPIDLAPMLRIIKAAAQTGTQNRLKVINESDLSDVTSLGKVIATFVFIYFFLQFSAPQVVQELHRIGGYVECVDHVPESVFKRRAGSGVELAQAHYPYGCVGYKDLVIARGTVGTVQGKLVYWRARASLWDVAVGEMEHLNQQVTTCKSCEMNSVLLLLMIIHFYLFIII